MPQQRPGLMRRRQLRMPLATRPHVGNPHAEDRRVSGEWQFHSAHKKEICPVITAALSGSCPAIKRYTPNCGNGIVEGDSEECEYQDKSTSCRMCTNYKLTGGAECSPDEWGLDQLHCTSSGRCSPFGQRCAASTEEAGHCAQGKCQATHIDCQRNDDQNVVDGKVSEQFNPPGSNWFTHVTMNGTLCADMGPVSISTPWVPDHDCTWLCAFPDEHATHAASKNRKPCGDIGERLQAKQDEFGRRLNTVPAGNLCRLQQAPATQHGTCTSEGTQTRTRTAHHHQPHPLTSGQSDP